MWNKFANSFRSRQATPSHDSGPNDQTTGVVTHTYEPQDQTVIPFPSPSPPNSPSKASRKRSFKRLSKAAFSENADTFSKNGFSKVMSSLRATGSESSLSRASADSIRRQSHESGHPSVESGKPPSTPTDTKPPSESRFGSLRSILKPNNAPGTGQSVRFFSRDAYRVISPDQSSTSEFDDPSLVNRLQRSPPSRPSVQGVFLPASSQSSTREDSSPLGAISFTQAVPPPDIGNIFNLSADELPTIGAVPAPLHDSAIEISETDDQSMTLETIDEKSCIEELTQTLPTAPSPTIKFAGGTHDRSHSFTFAQTLMQSMPESSSTSRLSPHSNRNRALSDTVFTSLLQSPVMVVGSPRRPEADINDACNAIVAYRQSPEGDPFAANATTYYTPGTMLPPSPPQSQHVRTASREEDDLWSVRTQLALHVQMCQQYEVDLGARNELVEVLNVRLAESEKENERYKGKIRSWRKRVAELERCVMALEEEVDRSREESAERSVMDEASGEALRMLHVRIEELEWEKNQSESRETGLRAELEAKNDQLSKVQDDLARHYPIGDTHDPATEKSHVATIQSCPEDVLGVNKNLQQVQSRDHATQWAKERAELLASNDALRDEQLHVQSQLTSLQQELTRKEDKLTILQSELEAQWKHAEQHSEQIEKLKRNKDELMREVESLREKLLGAQSSWDESGKAELEAELQEAWTAKDELERERDELEQQLQAEQEHAEELTRELQEREDRVSSLEREHSFALDSVKRLQDNLRQRDAEIAEHVRRIRESEAKVEEAREGLTKQKRDHNRIVDEQSRRIAEVVAREVEARANLEQLIRERAETDVEITTSNERISSLMQELDKLRKQVRELHQESADKEVKLVRLTKQVSEYKEEVQQINVALDSKQQEVELMKRNGGAVKPPIGSALASRARRESSMFATPSISRPPSSLSEASTTTKDRKSSETSAAVPRPSLTRSVRPNSTVVNSVRRIDTSVRPTSVVKSRASPTSALATLPPRSPPVSSGLSRSPSVTPVASHQRRPSSSLESLRNKTLASNRSPVSLTSNTSEQDKENIDATPVAATRPARRMSVAVPA